MTAFIADASVAANWALEDEFDHRADVALDLAGQYGVIVPQFWHIEIRNVLLIASRRGRISAEMAQGQLERLTGLIDSTDEHPDLEIAFALAQKHRLTFYDALYLELAVRLQAPLSTLDGALIRAAVAEGLEVIR